MRKRKPRRRWFPSHHDQFAGRRGWGAIIAVVGLIALVSVAVVVCVARFSREANPVVTAELLRSGGDVRLSASVFQDGQARFYRYNTSGGREVRFFVMKTSDGVTRAAFDGCERCYQSRRGYRQLGNVLVCNACGQRFASTGINVVQGGCNPMRLEQSLEGDQIVLKAASLELGAPFF